MFSQRINTFFAETFYVGLQYNGMKSNLINIPPHDGMSSNPVMYALLIWINFMSQSDTALRHIALLKD